MVDLTGHEAGNGGYSQRKPTAHRVSSTRKVPPAAGAGRNLQRLLERGLGRRRGERVGSANESVRAKTGELRPGSNVLAGGGTRLPDQGNAKIGQRDSGYLVVPSAARWSDTEPT